MAAGKITAVRIPFCSPPPVAEETIPTKVGPEEHPRSPASASIAKSMVPPFGMIWEARLNEPGQRIPTEKPQRPKPKKLKAGNGDREIKR